MQIVGILFLLDAYRIGYPDKIRCLNIQSPYFEMSSLLLICTYHFDIVLHNRKNQKYSIPEIKMNETRLKKF